MAAPITDEPNIGERVAYWRQRRGKSQRVLAGLAGISQPYLSQIETGRRAVDKRSTLVALAQALQVSVAELNGQPGDPTDPAKARATESVPATRQALIMRRAGATRPASGNGATAGDAVAAATDYVTLGPMLPGLIATSTGADLVRVGYAAMFHLRDIGYPDLAREVATLALDEARDTDDPTWLGVAEYVNASALPPETSVLAAALSRRAAETLQPHIGDPDARQAYGMLHLTAALRAATTRQPSDAVTHLDEAVAEAASLGEPNGVGLCALAFGPTSVDVWRMTVFGELGEYDRAAAVAKQVRPELLTVVHRQAAFWVDYCRILAILGRDSEAIAAFLRAEAVSPQWVRLRSTVRDTIAVILRRTVRAAIGPQLRRAAEAVGLQGQLPR
jgi:transcriptional regulator with XRE-family HTH domain